MNASEPKESVTKVAAKSAVRAPHPRSAGTPATEAKSARLQTLVEVGCVINASLDLDEVLHLVLEQGSRAVDAEAATFWLLEGERLIPRVVLGPSAEAVRLTQLTSGEGLVGQAILLRTGLLVDDVRRYPLWASHIDRTSGFTTRTVLCVPIESRGRILGALQFVNKRGGNKFDNTDLQLATGLARQAALAVTNSLLFEESQRVHEGLIRALVAAVEACDPCTAGHSERVSRYTLALADAVGLKDEARKQAEWAGLLHDVGKIRVLPIILAKRDRLDAAEAEMVRTHAQVGADMIRSLDPGRTLRPVEEAVRHHHERYDGTGYPEGLHAAAIPLLARLVAIANAYDNLTAGCPGHKAVGHNAAMRTIAAEAGSHFDPALAAAFVAAIRPDRVTGGRPLRQAPAAPQPAP